MGRCASPGIIAIPRWPATSTLVAPARAPQLTTSTPTRFSPGSGAHTLTLVAYMRTTLQPPTHLTLSHPALADDVKGVSVLAEPRQVHARVVPHHPAVPDSAAQTSPARVGVHTDLDEVIEHPARCGLQFVDRLAIHPVEGPLQLAALVQREGLAGVDLLAITDDHHILLLVDIVIEPARPHVSCTSREALLATAASTFADVAAGAVSHGASFRGEG